MAPMYRPGTAQVLDGPGAAEAEFVRVTAIGAATAAAVALPVTTALPVAGALPVAATLPVALAGVVSNRGLPCAEDPDLFFAESPDDVELAKSLCCDCPARMACLGGAVERREPWGVWGGELFLRGEVVPRKRARGRPRKSDVAA
jgi:WhiB family transcriptional regulator, redox-sensing transcriptional regulator